MLRTSAIAPLASMQAATSSLSRAGLSLREMRTPAGTPTASASPIAVASPTSTVVAGEIAPTNSADAGMGTQSVCAIATASAGGSEGSAAKIIGSRMKGPPVQVRIEKNPHVRPSTASRSCCDATF